MGTVGDVEVTEPARPEAETADGLPVFSVVDIETSGLSTRRHRILQVAVARVVDGEIVDEWGRNHTARRDHWR